MICSPRDFILQELADNKILPLSFVHFHYTSFTFFCNGFYKIFYPCDIFIYFILFFVFFYSILLFIFVFFLFHERAGSTLPTALYPLLTLIKQNTKKTAQPILLCYAVSFSFLAAVQIPPLSHAAFQLKSVCNDPAACPVPSNGGTGSTL